jgi:hypothetical protein
MSVALWDALGIVCAGGAVGGLVNAFGANQGFGLPKTIDEGGARIWKPGGLGTVLVGAFAAGVNWGLYGPFSSYLMYGTSPANQSIGVTLAALVTAALIGYAGARWLTNEVDKKFLRTAAEVGAAADPSSKAAAMMATATPEGCLEIASKMRSSTAGQDTDTSGNEAR